MQSKLDESLSRIVVVEDDGAIRTILEMALSGAGYKHVRSFGRGDDALAAIRIEKPDLVLLDLMLPGLDGVSIAKSIRADRSLDDTRIIMLTAMTQGEDIVRGLDAGADDYITKPFERQILLARIRAVLRRGVAGGAALGFDGLAIDPKTFSATLDGVPLRLPRGEFKILSLLSANKGRVLSRQRILDAVLSDDLKSVTERTVDVQIATLRRKLGRWGAHVETVRGVGYRVG
ncbi:MAG: response regulator transcription factor [Kiritimatiellae bacterium]|nr:response regulator transcription factor [Kiritimatiellia bacterium]